MYQFHKRLKDPFLGEILLDETAQELVTTDIIKRLYFIKKLDLANLVYPSATHTYFGHVLGTMVLAERVAEEFDLHPEDVEHLKVASLLADSCIPPFQTVMQMLPHYVPSSREAPELKSIILQSEIQTILKSHNIDANRVLSIIRGQDSNEILNQLITGPFPLSYLDSVIRDAYYLGFSGDTQLAFRILRHLTTVELGNRRWLAVGKEALSDFQRLLITREQLFQQVYHNNTVLSARLMLRKILESLFARETLTTSDLVTMSDEDLLLVLKNILRGKLRTLLEDLMEKRFFTLAFSLRIDLKPDIVWRFWFKGAEYLERSLEQVMIKRCDVENTSIAVKVSPFRIFEENNIPIVLDERITDIRRLSPITMKQLQNELQTQGIRCFVSSSISRDRQSRLRKTAMRHLELKED